MAFDSFADARSFADDPGLEADICIMGAGAAGITLASALADSGLRVCLLEAGGMDMDPVVEDASIVPDIGRPYDVTANRLRFFGGATNHWGGHCVRLEPDDFEPKDWIPMSGWPFGADTLAPYYRQAHAFLGLGEYEYDPAPVARALGTRLMPFDGPMLKSQLSRYRRVFYGDEYGPRLDRAPNVRVVLYADVCDIRLGEASGETVSHVVVRSPAGNRFDVRARYFVLAAGGIEIPRMLLVANGQRPAGLGNENDLVGRYFQEHLMFKSGLLLPRDPADVLPLYLSEVPYGDIAVRCHLVLTAEAVRARRIGKFRSEFYSLPLRLRDLRALRSGRIDAADIAGLVSDPFGTARAYRCGSNARHDTYGLFNNIEQRPNPASRVSLRADKDAYGRPQAQLDWQITRQDHDCILAAHQVIAQEAGRIGFGRMRIEIDPEPEVFLDGVGGGGHHMGTVRMAEDPRRGVTDGDGRLHSVENLYVAGSALFPTGGYPNPTLTITAMAFRLSDHLKARAEREGLL
ncbi:GMC oxidoreductase [Rhodovulum sulfidophilum]|uniref:GMC oxidoreductase n=1 Tax=Rhodovulum sulfidophilum TaxID=35806 RepID=A0A0D6B157_RHOSU|nr:GMC oxidoreductase [Rhodovulum sulfidophilum]